MTLILGLILVAAAVGLFMYGPEASAPSIPAPEKSPEDLTATTTVNSILDQASSTPIAKPAGQVHSVSIEGMAFSPAAVEIKVGDMVAWTNKDAAPHTATGQSFDSGKLNQGESFAFRFEKSGTYSYVCSLHPSMKGAVVVK